LHYSAVCQANSIQGTIAKIAEIIDYALNTNIAIVFRFLLANKDLLRSNGDLDILSDRYRLLP